MAWYEGAQLKDGNITAQTSLASYQYYPVVLDATGYYSVVADGTRADGILRNAPVAGEACEVVLTGVAMARLGASCSTKGALLMTASGGLVPYSAGGTNVVSARLRDQTGTTGDIVPVTLKCGF